MRSFETLQNDKYVPKQISNDTIELSYIPDDYDIGKLITTIKWKPAEGEHSIEIYVGINANVFQKTLKYYFLISDMICNYLFHLYATKDYNSALNSRFFWKLKVFVSITFLHVNSSR